MVISKRAKDITGKRFGKLVAMQPVGIHHQTKGIIWECQCDCGNIHTVATSVLLSGNTQSCGCIQKELIHARVKSMGSTPALKALWHDYRKNARRRNLEFTLTFTEFEQLTSDLCRYCGATPSKSADKRFLVPYIYNGIDRKNNDVGYTFDNCVTCCTQCNFAKHIMNEKDFIQWINRVHNHLKNTI